MNSFFLQWADELNEIEEYSESASYGEIPANIYRLCKNHAENIKGAIERMRDKYDSPWSSHSPRSFFSMIINNRIYQRDLPVSEIYEHLNSYDAGQRPVRAEMKLPSIPARGLKQLLKEKCRELINNDILKEPITETRHSKAISSILIPVLEKEYTLTVANKTTISDYFRKGELLLIRKTGKLLIVDTYPRLI